MITTLVGAYFIAHKSFAKKDSMVPNVEKISSVLSSGLASLSQSNRNPKTKIIEINRKLVNNNLEYVFKDDDNQTIVGINKILTHFTNKGFSIVNTLKLKIMKAKKSFKLFWKVSPFTKSIL